MKQKPHTIVWDHDEEHLAVEECPYDPNDPDRPCGFAVEARHAVLPADTEDEEGYEVWHEEHGHPFPWVAGSGCILVRGDHDLRESQPSQGKGGLRLTGLADVHWEGSYDDSYPTLVAHKEETPSEL